MIQNLRAMRSCFRIEAGRDDGRLEMLAAGSQILHFWLMKADHDDDGGAAEPVRSHGGLQSLDVALPVLFALSNAGEPLALSELARRTGMPASKVHRYVSSFVHAGLMEQRKSSRLYDLGPAAMRLGIAALGRNDFTERTIETLPDLVAETGLAAHVTVWGTHGAVIVRWEREPNFPTSHLGLGATLSLLDSSAGRVFLAKLPEPVTARSLAEAKEHSVTAAEARRKGTPIEDVIAGLRDQVLTEGVATTDWPYQPSFCSIAAPVLNWDGEVETVVTLVGLEHDRQILERGSHTRDALLAFAKAISVA